MREKAQWGEKKPSDVLIIKKEKSWMHKQIEDEFKEREKEITE